VRLFENLQKVTGADFEVDRVVESPTVTHLRYRIVR
jgi:hypothetical protein